MSSSRSPWSKRSLTAQAMGHVDPITKAIVPPIHVTTTYIRDEDNAFSSGFVYGRPDNATIVVTHYQRLLNYIVPDVVHVLAAGRIVKSGGKELALELEAKGYDWLTGGPRAA